MSRLVSRKRDIRLGIKTSGEKTKENIPERRNQGRGFTSRAYTQTNPFDPFDRQSIVKKKNLNK